MDNTQLIRDTVIGLLEPGFDLYHLEVIPGKKEYKIRVFLDKLDNPYGTPAIDDCVRHSRAISAKLTDLSAEGKIPEDYSLEVSSPGAERELKSPEEWERFRDLPLKVLFDLGSIMSLVLHYQKSEDGNTFWIIADVSFNTKQGKAVKKMKKEERALTIPQGSVKSVKLYLDFSG